MKSQRILIAGLSSYLGGRLAQALEREPEVEALIGIDTRDPRHELDRTEFVRIGTDNAALKRVLAAAAIDTVVDTRLIADPLLASLQHGREVNVIGTSNLVAACADSRSPVRKILFKSSAHYYGCGPGNPAFFTEQMPAASPARTAIERQVAEAERIINESSNSHRTITILRLADQIPGDGRASLNTLLNLPVVPSILGIDPRFQFVHDDDVVGALAHAVRHDLPGIYNVAGDGVLALSEVASLLGKPLLPALPPWGTAFAAAQLRRLGLRIPLEMVRQLRFGRGLDNRRLKSAGYHYRYTTREALLQLRAQQKLRPLLRSGSSPYRYDREVEEFLRRSPSVRPARPSGNDRIPPAGYDALTATELIEIIPSLEAGALHALHDYEVEHQARDTVLEALERAIARKEPS